MVESSPSPTSDCQPSVGGQRPDLAGDPVQPRRRAHVRPPRPEKGGAKVSPAAAVAATMRISRCLMLTGVVMSIITVFGVIAIFIAHEALGYPFHASCKIKWKLSLNCDSVRTGIINQMNEWKDDDCPTTSESCPEMPCGQKCLYEFGNVDSDGRLHGTHSTPVARYVDHLTFDFENSRDDGKQGCTVEGFSTSGVWYAYLDFGTNYCNLRNLIDGAAFSRTDDFVEVTDTSVCTQYDSLNCERF